MTSPDGDTRRKAKRYQAIRLKLIPVRFLVGIAFLPLMLAGVSQGLAASLSATFNNWAAVVAAYFVVFSIAYSLWQLPLNFYQGHVVEKRFALSTELAASWMVDWVKGLLVSLVVGLPVVLIVYWLLRVAPQWWWVGAAVAVTLVGIVLANLAPVLIYPLFFKFEPLDDPEIRDRLSVLAEKSGIRFSGIFRMELSVKSAEAEALLTGMGRTRRIVLSDTLLDKYDLDEIETILAHELGHHALMHLPILVAAQAVGAFGALFIISVALRLSVGHLGLTSTSDIANLPLILVVLSVLQLLGGPLGNWWSRRLEARADTFALDLTLKPGAFARALLQLADQNLADIDPGATAEALVYSHPPIGRRVEAARQFAQAHGLDFDLSAGGLVAADADASEWV